MYMSLPVMSSTCFSKNKWCCNLGSQKMENTVQYFALFFCSHCLEALTASSQSCARNKARTRIFVTTNQVDQSGKQIRLITFSSHPMNMFVIHWKMILIFPFICSSENLDGTIWRSKSSSIQAVLQPTIITIFFIFHWHFMSWKEWNS